MFPQFSIIIIVEEYKLTMNKGCDSVRRTCLVTLNKIQVTTFQQKPTRCYGEADMVVNAKKIIENKMLNICENKESYV